MSGCARAPRRLPHRPGHRRHDAGRQYLGEQAQRVAEGERHFLRQLHHHRVAGQQRRRQSAERQVHRSVPGGDDSHRSHRHGRRPRCRGRWPPRPRPAGRSRRPGWRSSATSSARRRHPAAIPTTPCPVPGVSSTARAAKPTSIRSAARKQYSRFSRGQGGPPAECGDGRRDGEVDVVGRAERVLPTISSVRAGLSTGAKSLGTSSPAMSTAPPSRAPWFRLSSAPTCRFVPFFLSCSPCLGQRCGELLGVRHDLDQHRMLDILRVVQCAPQVPQRIDPGARHAEAGTHLGDVDPGDVRAGYSRRRAALPL